MFEPDEDYSNSPFIMRLLIVCVIKFKIKVLYMINYYIIGIHSIAGVFNADSYLLSGLSFGGNKRIILSRTLLKLLQKQFKRQVNDYQLTSLIL